MYLPYVCVEALESLIQTEPIPLPSGMPKILQSPQICQLEISSCPGDATKILGSGETERGVPGTGKVLTAARKRLKASPPKLSPLFKKRTDHLLTFVMVLPPNSASELPTKGCVYLHPWEVKKIFNWF